MIRASGADTGMSRGLGGQLRRVKTDTFKKRFTKIGTGVATSKLKGGDFQLSRTHARIVVELGGKIYVAEAGYLVQLENIKKVVIKIQHIVVKN